MKAIYLVLVCVGVVASKPAGGEDDVVGSVIGVVKNCAEEDVSLCLKVCVIVSCARFRHLNNRSIIRPEFGP